MTLKRGMRSVKLLWRISVFTHQPFDQRHQIWSVNICKGGAFSRGSDTPTFMDRSKRPPYSGTPPTPISFDLEQPKFGMVTYVGKRVSRGLATPPSQGAGSQRPQILWNLLHARTQHENQRPNFSWRSSYRCSENIYRSTTPTARAKCLATRMLTRDLFALANLVACSSTITAISGHTNLF